MRTLDSGDPDTYLPTSWSNPNEIDELPAGEPIDYLSNLPPDDANQVYIFCFHDFIRVDSLLV